MAHFPRLHLFEWEDQQWFPVFLRNCMTDFLEFISTVMKLYAPIPDVISECLAENNTLTILDLGSGGGGPWRQILPIWKENNLTAKVILSDFYPNLVAFEKLKSQFPEYIDFKSDPVNAMDVQVDQNVVRTQFLSLHHFKPEDATSIFANAVKSGNAICIVEGQQRTIQSMIGMIFSPINALFMTPFIRPFRFDRILFTYLIPILPLLIMWDGMVSVLRTYTSKELHAMAAAADPDRAFDWRYQSVGKGGIVNVFIGVPKA